MNANFGQILLFSRLAGMGFEDHRQAVKNDPDDHHVKHRNGRPVRHPRSRINAVVIHATDTVRSQTRATRHFDSINTHFVVLKRGKVLYLHDIEEYLNASHGFNSRAIAIEHELKPPDASAAQQRRIGQDKDVPTREQIMASRLLLQTLKEAIPHLRFIYAHRQAAAKLCPGPHLWYNVVYWAERNLNLTSGGRYSIGAGGTPIAKYWYDDRFDLMGEAKARAAAGITAHALAAIGADYPLP